MIRIIILCIVIAFSGNVWSGTIRTSVEIVSKEYDPAPNSIDRIQQYYVDDKGNMILHGLSFEYDPAGKCTLVKLFKDGVLLAFQRIIRESPTGKVRIIDVDRGVFPEYESVIFLTNVDVSKSAKGHIVTYEK